MNPAFDHTIDISSTQTYLAADRSWLTDLIRRVLTLQNIRSAQISVVLVDDSTIHQINRDHLGHDWPTDIITFPLSEPNEPRLTAELVVSAQMAAETAQQAGTDPLAELALYLVHGLLHLAGYDDLDESNRLAMRRREAQVLQTLGIPNTFDRSPTATANPPPVSETPPCSA